jgi:hypothetical protein
MKPSGKYHRPVQGMPLRALGKPRQRARWEAIPSHVRVRLRRITRFPASPPNADSHLRLRHDHALAIQCPAGWHDYSHRESEVMPEHDTDRIRAIRLDGTATAWHLRESRHEMFKTPPFALPPKTLQTVSFPFRVPKTSCAGSYTGSPATYVNNKAVDTSVSSLTVKPHWSPEQQFPGWRTRDRIELSTSNWQIGLSFNSDASSKFGRADHIWCFRREARHSHAWSGWLDI